MTRREKDALRKWMCAVRRALYADGRITPKQDTEMLMQEHEIGWEPTNTNTKGMSKP